MPANILQRSTLLTHVVVAGLFTGLSSSAFASDSETKAQSSASTTSRKLVSVFVADRSKKAVYDAVNITGNKVRKDACGGKAVAYEAQGPYRAWDDGIVEFLALPLPYCPGERRYVWVALPR